MKFKTFSLLFIPISLLLLSSFNLWAESSETNAKLKQALQKYPQADANKDGVLTLAEAKAYKSKLKSKSSKTPTSGLTPDHVNVAYGQDEKQTFDLWLAKSDSPTPLLICIHGGGFKGGDKAKFHKSPIVTEMLEQGISVATINYRLTDGGKNAYPIPMHDGAKAIQYLRFHADKYNLDKQRFAATGGSAGGCMSLWLAFHNDLADPSASDPVLQESSRLLAIAPNGAQTTLELADFIKIFECDDLQEHPGFRPLFNLPEEGEPVITSEVKAQMKDASPITHLTTDDPPVFLTYGGSDIEIDANSTPGQYVHHPKLGMFLKSKMDSLGMECHLSYRNGTAPEKYENSTEFLIAKLKQ